MHEPAPSTPEFSELWRNVSKLCHSKTQDRKTVTQMPSPRHQDLQSPQRKGYSKFSGLNNGDSPGDVEPSQDIFWDPTSPTPANGLRNNRVVEISDIVNRIAPKDVKRKGTESPLLQWIGDTAVPCTPDVPRPRMRKRSSRQSSVEDLMKLARQFDENMQQDRETSEQPHTDNNNLTKCVDKTGLTSKSPNVKEHKCTSSSEQAEAELHALFDCSTQKVSGRLSQGSSVSACSQEVRKQPVASASASAQPKQIELKTSSKSVLAAQPAGGKESGGFRDDFDDDWENDDLLNDSFVLEITQNPDQLLDNKPKTSLQSKTTTAQFTSVCNPPAADHDDEVVCPAANSVRNITDRHWDDGDDDDLLFQICDSVERISNSQPEQVRPRCEQDKCDNSADRQRTNTRPLPIDATWSTNTTANRKSPCPFVRSNSLPGSSCHAVNYRGWDIPMKGANNKPGMSQSLPGSRMGRGTFSNCMNSSGTFQTGNASSHTVTAGASQNSKSHHTAFKRNLSDSAVLTNKVFVTSQMTAKCSAAEIERKKQEALARRRLRMQNTQKP